MCGICGVISPDPGTIKASVAAMMRAMHHRGPDDGGFELLPLGPTEAGPFAGFGFRRLSILDLSPAGHQPMFNPATGDCVVFNGEIYNFRELRAELVAAGVQFRSSGDTEVLLHALSSWREETLVRIQGMFALAFYHASTRRILLARDPLGIKPLYVATTGKAFVFASEIRAVQMSGLVSDALDVAGIAGMLAYGAVQSPRTVYQAIRSFPAGAYAWIGADASRGSPGAEPRRFWNFAARPTQQTDRVTTVAEVRRLLRTSIQRHLVADVPVGVFLSAGIDSTVVASLAREYAPEVTAFTVGFEAEHGEDEVRIAADTAKSLGIRHVTAIVDSGTLQKGWHNWLATMDCPSVDGFNTFIVSESLAKADIVVALSGLGADELFGGYSTFRDALRLSSVLRRLRLLPPALRAMPLTMLGRVYPRLGLIDKLADLVAGDTSVADISRSLRRALSSRHLRAMRLRAESLGLRPDYLDPASPHLTLQSDGDEFNDISRAEFAHYMGDMLLRDTDAVSMRHSLEVRVPFLDLPLVDYVSSLPGSVKRPPGGLPKELLREAAASELREAITSRPKTGFTLPIGRWMRREMRDPCTAAVDHVAGLPFMDSDAVRGVWNAFLRNEKTLHWSRPLAIVVLGSYLMASPNTASSSLPVHAYPVPGRPA